MIRFQIAAHSGVPAYRQLMDQVKYYVASRVLNPGDKLPSIRELARALVVNPTTVVKAYSELEHEGVIEMQHGRGVFIASTSPRMTPRQREDVLRPLARQLAVEAQQLGVSIETVSRLLDEETTRLVDRHKEE